MKILIQIQIRIRHSSMKYEISNPGKLCLSKNIKIPLENNKSDNKGFIAIWSVVWGNKSMEFIVQKLCNSMKRIVIHTNIWINNNNNRDYSFSMEYFRSYPMKNWLFQFIHTPTQKLLFDLISISLSVILLNCGKQWRIH